MNEQILKSLKEQVFEEVGGAFDENQEEFENEYKNFGEEILDGSKYQSGKYIILIEDLNCGDTKSVLATHGMDKIKTINYSDGVEVLVYKQVEKEAYFVLEDCDNDAGYSLYNTCMAE